MSPVRMAAIAAAALVAALAAVRAALWMTARPAPETPAEPTSVEIEIPKGAGPSTAAQLDTTAALDPGRALDAGSEGGAGGTPGSGAQPVNQAPSNP